MKTDTPRPIRLEDYKPSSYLIDEVDLDVALDATKTRVRARLKIRPNPAAKEKAGPLRLDGEILDLQAIRLDGKALGAGDYEANATGLTIPRVPAKPFTLETVVHINPEANKALQGLYVSRGIFCTQCEAQGFRRITYFIDRPDILSVYRTRIEADVKAAPVLLSNGNMVERGSDARTGRHYAVWTDPFPKPCYLFALVGGNLSPVASTFRTMSGRNVDLRIYVEPGKEDRCGWAMDSLKRSMRWDEVRFGREYDLDIFMIVAVSDFNMGAMENKGLNIFNDKLILASPETAEDGMYEAIEAVVAHEYFHNWTGNRITCRDWFQLCLKEGLTVYRDQEFSSDERSRSVQRIADVRHLKAMQFPEDAGPLAHPVRPESYIEINNFYTMTVYEKGAELCRMIETLIGRDTFRAGMDLYFARHDGEAATVEQFLACFGEASGRDLSQFMLWYAQAGTPELACDLVYDRAKKEAVLTVRQSVPPTPGQPKKKPMLIPLRLGLVGANGQDQTLKLDDGRVIVDGLVELSEAEHTFRFTDVASRPVPSLLRGFSAPVNLRIDLSDKDLEHLIANDSDLYNRWQAAQTYATRAIVHIVTALRAGKRATRGLALARALGAMLRRDDLEPAYLAQMLSLPSEADVAREIGKDVDPGAIHKARRQLRRLVATTIGDGLEQVYKATAGRGLFSPDAASAGRRALRLTALALLHLRGSEKDLARTNAHFKHADNMTDATGALALLAEKDGPARDSALAAFYERWKDDHLVIDRWFSIQAMAARPGIVGEVRTLMSHPLFALTNPNKVRALVGGFAQFNPTGFNAPDGAGYRLVAEAVLALEKFNPQIAARLLGAFRSWRTLEAGRRRHAKKALEMVARTEGLSRDVYEIVSRTLE